MQLWPYLWEKVGDYVSLCGLCTYRYSWNDKSCPSTPLMTIFICMLLYVVKSLTWESNSTVFDRKDSTVNSWVLCYLQTQPPYFSAIEGNSPQGNSIKKSKENRNLLEWTDKIQFITKLQGQFNACSSSLLTFHKEHAAHVQVCFGHKTRIRVYFFGSY